VKSERKCLFVVGSVTERETMKNKPVRRACVCFDIRFPRQKRAKPRQLFLKQGKGFVQAWKFPCRFFVLEIDLTDYKDVTIRKESI